VAILPTKSKTTPLWRQCPSGFTGRKAISRVAKPAACRRLTPWLHIRGHRDAIATSGRFMGNVGWSHG
jgi:hypothetical protein